MNVSCTVLKEQMRKPFVDTSVVNGKLSVFQYFSSYVLYFTVYSFL